MGLEYERGQACPNRKVFMTQQMIFGSNFPEAGQISSTISRKQFWHQPQSFKCIDNY